MHRRPNQRYQLKFVKPSIKHGGGSIIIWDCFSYYGVGSLHLINGIMDQNVYKDILVDNLQYSADLMGLADMFVFQQDLDPKFFRSRFLCGKSCRSAAVVSTKSERQSERKLVVDSGLISSKSPKE
jgi:hypothetical protein